MTRIQKACRTLYPSEYKRLSFIEFAGLPYTVSARIHQLRVLDDMRIPIQDAKHLLGYGQHAIKDSVLDMYLRFPNINIRVSIPDDRQIVLIACYRGFERFQDASETLKNHEKTVIDACRIQRSNFQYASKRLRLRPSVIQTVFNIHSTEDTEKIIYVLRNFERLPVFIRFMAKRFWDIDYDDSWVDEDTSSTYMWNHAKMSFVVNSFITEPKASSTLLYRLKFWEIMAEGDWNLLSEDSLAYIQSFATTLLKMWEWSSEHDENAFNDYDDSVELFNSFTKKEVQNLKDFTWNLSQVV